MKTREERIAALLANSRSGFVEGDKKMLEASSDERLTAFEVATTKSDELVQAKKTRIDKLLANAKSGLTEGDRKMLEVTSDERLTAFETAATKEAPEPKVEPKVEEVAQAKKTRIDKLLANAKSGLTEGDRKMLEVASDERLTAFETAAAKVEETPKPKTEKEFMAEAPEEIRSMVERQRAVDAARRVELVAALEKGQKEYNKEELEKMNLEQLERLNRALGSVVAQPRDFSGLAPRAPVKDEGRTPPPPIDLNARIKAARQA